MRNFLFVFAVLCFTIFPAFGQRRGTSVKAAPKKIVATVAPIAEISAKDWDQIIAALDGGNWAQAALLSSASINKLKADNDKKQLARLRYFYVYALAGQVADGKTTFAELEKVADGFIGTEFLMPSREILADCAGKINYICAVKDDENMLRVTATDKSAAIHSFEYVGLPEKFHIAQNSGRSAVVAGTLRKVESNLTKAQIRIIRLIFDDGFVNLIPEQ